MTKENLNSIVWQCFLDAEKQHENWTDEDTCRLITNQVFEQLGKTEHLSDDCPGKNECNLIYFTPDLDLCENCGKTFDGK